MNKSTRQNLAWGLFFLGPNILGFLAFTLIPLVLSMALAFSNWDLRLHNMFKDDVIRFVGIDNFARLLSHPDFWKFLGNTLFFMMTIPIAIVGNLILAILLSQDMGRKHRMVFWALALGAVLGTSITLLVMAGSGSTAMSIMLVSVFGLILIAGVLGGSSLYRMFFYLPAFTSGVATYILWAKLYNPYAGPINNMLAGPLEGVGGMVNALPPGTMSAGVWAVYGLIIVTFAWGVRRFRQLWRDGYLGSAAVFPAVVSLLIGMGFAVRWSPGGPLGTALIVGTLVVLGWHLVHARKGAEYPTQAWTGSGTGLVLGGGLMVGIFVLIGLANTFHALPAMAASEGGLQPPEWLTSYHWAKPALMIMGLWGAIGSNTMILYLAGLSNIPRELYEAADIDGARGFQRFWNVTWPQLAPVTFFVFVMGIIGGLQGGFEMAYAMTKGGPAGATTTLSYFIYAEGFETGRLGYASAVAWTLFAMVFLVTLFNWKFGNRYVNE